MSATPSGGPAFVAPVRPEVRTYNLAAPDSPRWNDYFVDLALAIGATPVRRLGPTQLKLDAWLAGPPIKASAMLLKRVGHDASRLPAILAPGLLGLWARHVRLDSSAAERDLGLTWTSYAAGLEQSTEWFLEIQDHADRHSANHDRPQAS